jgi:hypothetical protein
MSAADDSLQSLQVALECWAKFGLDARRTALDAQAARIAESQDLAVKSRRELTEQTKVRVCLCVSPRALSIESAGCEEAERRRACGSDANVAQGSERLVERLASPR